MFASSHKRFINYFENHFSGCVGPESVSWAKSTAIGVGRNFFLLPGTKVLEGTVSRDGSGSYWCDEYLKAKFIAGGGI